MRILLALACILSIAFALCANECSNNGVCQNGECVCNANWAGSDCSVALTTLTSGVAKKGETVGTRAWHYYKLQVGAGVRSVIFSVNETSTGDADIYILKNAFPDRTNWFKKDVSVHSAMKIEVTEDQGAGDWYLGIYGFISVTYDVSITTTQGACPNQCSNHGTCMGSECSCDPGFSGDDCSQGVQALQDDHFVSSSVADSQWTYFSFTIGSSSDLIEFDVEQQSAGDVDLYLKYNEIPTLQNYDFKETSLDNDFSIVIDEPTPGTWYAGVYGFRGCSFQIKAKYGEVCPNQCSGTRHGTCAGTSCECKAGFTGQYCETMTSALVLGQTIEGFVSDNTWNYYHVNSFTTNNLLIDVLESNPSDGDCDLYVQRDQNPTRMDYVYRDLYLRDHFNLTIEDPADATWYIGIYGFKTCGYELTVMETTACPNHCSGNGDCFNGFCDCYAGFSGDDCSSTLGTLSSALPVQGSVNSGDWKYYSISPSSNSGYVRIVLHEKETEGDLWLYVNEGLNPDLRVYQESSTTANAVKGIDFSGEAGKSYFIGVYANPLAPAGRAVDFELVVWMSPF